ncbi:MAG: putative sulfate exporter family transporter [Acidobacteriia bacterium]|nr:putative sulfate exporter family transporter [Terriglobia bacterium]
MNTKILFFVGLILCASGIFSAPIALGAGLAYGFSFAHPYQTDSRVLSKFLLQASVVGLGFGMNLLEVLHAGRSGIVYTAASISFVLAVGLMAGRLLRVNSISSALISAGTAICGGSAIAAIAPILDADQDQTAVSLGTIFILNSIALMIFPALGWALHLSQSQFGLWSALAIHDTSSVVGATARYGAVALAVGTTVKLTRALWIAPLAAGTAVIKGSKTRIHWPWFILLFCLATVVNTYIPAAAHLSLELSNLGRLGLTATLFLIGTSLSRATLQQVGFRPLVQGVILWMLVGLISLWFIVQGWIALQL